MSFFSKREIDFEVLASAISVYNNGWHGNQITFKRFIERFPDQQIIKKLLSVGLPSEIDFEAFLRDNPGYDPGLYYEFYTACLKMWIESEGLQKHIIIETNPKPKNIDEMNARNPASWESHYQYQAICSITIQKLTIVGKFGNFSMDSLQSKNVNAKTRDRGLHIIFRNNVFQKKHEYKYYITFFLGAAAFLELKNNTFIGMDIYIRPLRGVKNCFLNIDNNKFNNKHVSIFLALSSRGEGYIDASGWYISTEKYAVKKDFETRINEKITDENQKIKIDMNDMIPPQIGSSVTVKNNVFNILNIIGRSRFFFRGLNKINIFKNSAFYVHFDSPQHIDRKGQASFHHQELFSDLARKAIENKDPIQENIFKQQIQRYAHQQMGWKYRILLNVQNFYDSTRRTIVLLAAVITIIIAIINME